jgi:hypothetical protein
MPVADYFHEPALLHLDLLKIQHKSQNLIVRNCRQIECHTVVAGGTAAAVDCLLVSLRWMVLDHHPAEMGVQMAPDSQHALDPDLTSPTADPTWCQQE